jgi:hypothetical protein
MFGAVLGGDPGFSSQWAIANGADAKFCFLTFEANPQAPFLDCLGDAIFEVKELEWAEGIDCHYCVRM